MNGTLSSASDRDTGNLARECINAGLFVHYGTWRFRTHGVQNISVRESHYIYYTKYISNRTYVSNNSGSSLYFAEFNIPFFTILAYLLKIIPITILLLLKKHRQY